MLILIGIFVYMQGASHRGAAAASDQLLAAMDMQGQGMAELQATIKDYPGTSQAAVAELLLAENLLDSGTTTLYHNKTAGRDEYFQSDGTVRRSAKELRTMPTLRAWAIYGVARAQESLGDLEQARLAYVQVEQRISRQRIGRAGSPAFEPVESTGHERILRLVCDAESAASRGRNWPRRPGFETFVRH